MRFAFALAAASALALGLAGVAKSQCENGVCPLPVNRWQDSQSRSVNSRARPFVCRIRNATGSHYTYGSGTLVAKGSDYGVVVTCCHIFDEGTGTLSMRFPDGTVHAGQITVRNRQDDLAFITLARRPKAPIVKIATDYAKPGERISFAGYGRTGQYREVSGKAIGYLHWKHGRPNHNHVLNVTGGARLGDSGGPMLNARGELIGVLATTDNSTTQGTFNGRICAFATENRYLFRWNADLADKMDARRLEAAKPPVSQPPLPQQPVDLFGVNERLSNLESQQGEQLKLIDATANRLVPLEATADKARQLANQWPALQAALKTLDQTTSRATADAAKAVDSVTAVAGKATEAVEAANSTKAKVDAALDEDAPGGLLGKLRARLDDRLESTITGKVAAALAAKTGLPLGAIGGGLGLLAVVLVLFVRKDIKDKVETGDPLLIEKIAARTRNQIDDRLAEKLGNRIMAHADPEHGWREEMADIKGMLSGLRERISATAAQK